jgi:hypothetical protein
MWRSDGHFFDVVASGIGYQPQKDSSGSGTNVPTGGGVNVVLRPAGLHGPAIAARSPKVGLRNGYAQRALNRGSLPAGYSWPARSYSAPCAPQGVRPCLLFGRSAMDKLTKRGKPDRSKINMHEAWELLDARARRQVDQNFKG